MKTKILLFCLLFLVLGTTASWADKYYTVGSRVKGELEIGTGKKYMIYNTTFDGTQDRSGFLYNMGTTFGVEKFRSIDKKICNGAFVFTIEDAGDDDPHTIYLKSLPSNGYLDVNGIQHVDPVVLKLFTWDEAREGDTYTPDANGVTLTENGKIKQECVKSLNDLYTAVAEDKVTFESNAVYIIANEDTTSYFNGNEDSYAAWGAGHPYAFYECHELTSVSTFDIQDLHIYSRSDIFSAHKIYGYIKDASRQITSNYKYEVEGAITNLTDGDFKTYNNTDWQQNAENVPHYYQIDLETSVESLRLYMARRANGGKAPVEYELWASNSADDGYVKIDLDENNTGLDSRLAYVSPVISLRGSYRHIRIYGTTRTTPNFQCLALSELYVLPDREEINKALPYFDNTLPIAGTELEYKTKIDTYNRAEGGAMSKLFSGVPVPGNKYRIYADAYSNGVYVNRDLSISYDADNDAYSLTAADSYNNAADASAFEWYCEETRDGKLLFRNVKYPEWLLTNSNTAHVTNSADDAKWSINTNLTHRHGVPLKNSAEQYLTVFNTGENWMGDVLRVQDQTITTGNVDIKNTPDDQTDDIDLAESGGLCTDFVFLPVETTETEISVTIQASDLVCRNAIVTVDGVEYRLPFSKIFYNGVPQIEITSTADGYHNVAGLYSGETNIGSTISQDTYTGGQLKSGDILEARFSVEGLPEKSSDSEIKLYRIMNKRAKSVAQQAGMSRANIGYEDDEYTSLEDTKSYYYASFVSKDAPLELIYDENKLGAQSLFYFTNDVELDDESFRVFINSAVTTFKFNNTAEWTSGGSMHYIQPNAVGEGNKGFSITKTMLNADNCPGDAWCSSHSDAGSTVTAYSAEDAGAAWEFVLVEEEDAKEELEAYILQVAKTMIKDLSGKKGSEGLDDAKIESTIDEIKGITGQYDADSDNFTTIGSMTNANVTELVGYAQQLHMLHHKIEYALQELPEPTGTEEETENRPKWYYISNTFANSNNADSDVYARYNGANNLMKFNTTPTTLGNLFFLTGEKYYQGTKDEYVKAHIHNFMALNLRDATKDSTIVSQNKELFAKSVTPSSEGQTQIPLGEGETLKNNASWELTLEYNLADGAFFNGWGSGLIATGTDAAAPDKDANGDGYAESTYRTGFQVYLQSSGDIVVRGGDSGTTDIYKFKHTAGAYSKLKVVLTYANKRLQVAVTNSEGLTQTIKDTDGGLKNFGRDYIPCDYMIDITNLASAMSDQSNFSIKAEIVVAMKWDIHKDYNTGSEGSDIWYVLPSSNTTQPGLAIVTDNPLDTEMGWSNVNGEEEEIFTAPGNNDYSTWQFERVTDFTEHIAELLAMYNIDNCVIYNKELAELSSELTKLAAGDKNETTFNDMISAIRGYNGPMPEELIAPRPGSLYTVRPIEDADTKEALLVHVDKQDTYHATTEVYKGTVIDDDGDIDSRAVWMFEGDIDTSDPSGSFLNKSNLKARNIHTQTYLGAVGADATKLAQDGTAIALAPLGACITSIKAGDTYMSMAGDNRIDYSMNTYFWGYELDEYPAEINSVVDGFSAGKVHGKSMDIVVETEGNVTVTFTHDGGADKLNILGVKLFDADGNIENEEYHHGEAGDPSANNEYNLGTVAAGTYTLHCYVWDFDEEQSDNVDNAGGYITIDGAAAVKGLTNTGTENTKWIVEEILDPEADVCYTTTIENGYSTVMLGFDAKIPTGIEAYYGTNNGFVIDRRYLAMEKYEGNVLPAQAPVVLKNSKEGVTENAKFYYSKIGGSKQDDDYLNGKLWYTIVHVDEGVNLYMLQQDKEGPKMYWIYEEYNEAGDKVSPGADDGGHVACKANKAYILIDNGEAQSNGVFLFSFRPGETTGIYNIADEKYRNENGSVVEGIFDLQGRKLSEITSPGIYIVNGKKVIIK